ncbi:MAG: hypothetical protein U5J62_08085 [Desulfurivibrio sp.]|nr:hypothetical protein [Desulfurivibrio sp.]
MPINKMFSGGIEVMHQALNLRNERQGLIQSNIANLETPGYKVQDFPFAQAMERAMGGRGQLAQTDPRHIGTGPGAAARPGQYQQ